MSATHTGVGSPTRILAVLEGTIQPKSFMVISYAAYLPTSDLFFTVPMAASGSGMLAKTGGHVRLVDASGQVGDLVSWGSATAAISPWWKSTEIPPGGSIQRILPGDSNYTSGLVFAAPTISVTPGTANVPPEELAPDTPINACTDIVLSEILPNAVGTDGGKEFIEIYNPSEASIPLRGCRLQIGTGIPYLLPDEALAGGMYRAFYDTETSLTLPNTTAEAVQLITADGMESITYMDDMEADTTWALIGGTWRVTTLPTPNAVNTAGAPVVPSELTNNNVSVPQPCAAGKVRSPETNRCRNAAPAVTGSECKAGQVRNLETNRCRSASVVISGAMTACKANQERNLETNRCRVVQAASTAKSCPQGQERNATTNRCRKISAMATGHFAAIQDVPGSTLATNYRWWIVLAILLGAASYGLYEWRHDVANMLSRLKTYRWRSRTRD